ncbi:unnamed protein product, partial [Iphiclides podalirius]
MDPKLLIVALAISSALAHRDEIKEDTDIYDENYDYHYDDEPDDGNSVKRSKQINLNATTSRPATYEVTENVVDIPDTSTRIGPVVVNYTTARPLNNAGVSNNAANNITGPVNFNGNSQVSNHGFVDEADSGSAKPKKNSFSILHVKAEYDDKPSPPNADRPSGFKDYVLGLKRGIINGLYKLFKKKYSNEDTSLSTDHHESVHHKVESESSHVSRFGHSFRHNVDFEYD